MCTNLCFCRKCLVECNIFSPGNIPVHLPSHSVCPCANLPATGTVGLLSSVEQLFNLHMLSKENCRVALCSSVLKVKSTWDRRTAQYYSFLSGLTCKVMNTSLSKKLKLKFHLLSLFQRLYIPVNLRRPSFWLFTLQYAFMYFGSLLVIVCLSFFLLSSWDFIPSVYGFM